jgi:hypothetical protein
MQRSAMAAIVADINSRVEALESFDNVGSAAPGACS